MRNTVFLEERIYINKYAKNNQNVSAWLQKVICIQRNKRTSNPIDQFLNELDLYSEEPPSTLNQDQDDLGEWFSGAPEWIRRS